MLIYVTRVQCVQRWELASLVLLRVSKASTRFLSKSRIGNKYTTATYCITPDLYIIWPLTLPNTNTPLHATRRHGYISLMCVKFCYCIYVDFNYNTGGLFYLSQVLLQSWSMVVTNTHFYLMWRDKCTCFHIREGWVDNETFSTMMWFN